MLPDDVYLPTTPLAVARHLQHAGQWDLALEAIADLRTETAAALRAEILVDRHSWRLDPAPEALDAVATLEKTNRPLALLLAGQLAYWQTVFDLGGDPIVPDIRTAYADAARDARIGRWAVFFDAVYCQYIVSDADAAAEGFAAALAGARAHGDLLLESYAVRHQGEMRANEDPQGTVDLLRRSLSLRTGLGVRPHCAAAQATLASALGTTPEAGYLRADATRTAGELGLTWLARILAGEL
jgi:hypothetical protein